MSKFSFSQRSLDNLSGVHPDLVKVCSTALSLGVVDFTVIQGVRTQEEQDKLYAQGRTEPGDVVTWTRNSKHISGKDGYGRAVDLTPYPSFFEDRDAFFTLAGVMLSAASINGVAVTWGGSWNTKDLPHFELS